VVLVVERSSIPGDMNVHLRKIDVVRESSNQVESNILALDEGLWISRGAIIEGEYTLVIIALSPNNLG
jgi:hypothetical protein